MTKIELESYFKSLDNKSPKTIRYYKKVLFSYFEKYSTLKANNIKNYVKEYAENTQVTYARVFKTYCKYLKSKNKLDISKTEFDKICTLFNKREKTNLKDYPYVKLVGSYLKFKSSLNEKTKLNVEYILAKYFRDFKKIEVNNIQEFISQLAPLSQKLNLRYLKDFVKYLYEYKKIQISQEKYDSIMSIKSAKGDRINEPKEFNYTEYQKIFKRLSGDLGLVTSWFFAWNFGIRPQEIMSLRIEDIDLKKNEIRINQLLKSDKAQREIPFGSKDKDIIMKLIGNRKKGIMVLNGNNKPYKSSSVLTTQFARYTRMYLSDYDPRPHLYDGRYSFCTRMDRLGVPLGSNSVIMGHSRTSTTAGYLSRDKEAAKKLFRSKMC